MYIKYNYYDINKFYNFLGDKMKNKLKNRISSNKGFTMQDLIIACFIIIAFVGIISSLMYTVYKTNIKARLMSRMTVYSVKILENIDKISYEEVQTKTAQEYKNEFSIPDGFDVQIQISNYVENSNDSNDVIKIINLKLSYRFGNETEEFAVTKLKIKEI